MKDVVLIEKLNQVIPNKYEAIRVIAKEARRINSLLIRGAGEVEEKPTIMSLRRVLDSRVKFEYGELEVKKGLFDDDE